MQSTGGLLSHAPDSSVVLEVRQSATKKRAPTEAQTIVLQRRARMCAPETIQSGEGLPRDVRQEDEEEMLSKYMSDRLPEYITRLRELVAIPSVRCAGDSSTAFSNAVMRSLEGY